MIGFQIAKRERRAAPDIVEAFRALPVAVVSDSMHRMFAGGAALRPMHAGGMLSGPALTVRVRPGDNLMVHKAIDIAEPGDVIVVDGAAHTTNALIGELMITHARRRGVAGVVINGAIRDYDFIRSGDFPVFAVGVTHRGPYKDGPGEINVTVAIDGMAITPGDLVIGDADGLLAIPIDDAPAILLAAKAKQEAELRQMAMIENGENDRTWVDVALAARGVAL